MTSLLFRRPPCRELLELAAAVGRLEPSLTAALLPHAPGSDGAEHLPPSRAYAPSQLLNCSLALGSCAVLDSAMDLLGRDSYRIAAAAQLVLQAGQAYLALWPVRQFSGMVAGQMFDQDVSWLEARHKALCGTQLSTVVNILSILQRAGGVEHAFASSTARPAVLLPWWREITQALLDLPADPQPNGGEWV